MSVPSHSSSAGSKIKRRKKYFDRVTIVFCLRGKKGDSNGRSAISSIDRFDRRNEIKGYTSLIFFRFSPSFGFFFSFVLSPSLSYETPLSSPYDSLSLFLSFFICSFLYLFLSSLFLVIFYKEKRDERESTMIRRSRTTVVKLFLAPPFH